MSETAAQSGATYIDQRHIGDATITVISDGVAAVPLDSVFPPHEAAWLREHGEAEDGQLFAGDQAVIHVALGDASVVIDPAFDDPGTTWDRQFATRWPRVTRTPGLAAALASIGVAPEAVTHVLITHAHDDHFAGVVYERAGQLVPRFPNARHLIGRGDWEGNPRRAAAASDLVTRLGAIDALGLLEPVAGDREVAPGITFIHAPGESPGHSIVRVTSGGATFYALGDLFHHACEIANLDWHSPWVEPAAMRASRERFLAEAVPQDATIVFTHEVFPFWGRIVREGEGYRWVRG
jgi:glyoxylase-like metal-dependent hydrolase (beta-lactamase superfamily II)